MFVGAAAKSLQLGAKIADVARRCRAAFVDAGTVVEASTIDAIHLDSDAHRALGVALAKAVEGVFPAKPGARRSPRAASES
jgi:hypothetical protein